MQDFENATAGRKSSLPLGCGERDIRAAGS